MSVLNARFQAFSKGTYKDECLKIFFFLWVPPQKQNLIKVGFYSPAMIICHFLTNLIATRFKLILGLDDSLFYSSIIISNNNAPAFVIYDGSLI